MSHRSIATVTRTAVINRHSAPEQGVNDKRNTDVASADRSTPGVEGVTPHMVATDSRNLHIIVNPTAWGLDHPGTGCPSGLVYRRGGVG